MFVKNLQINYDAFHTTACKQFILNLAQASLVSQNESKDFIIIILQIIIMYGQYH